MGVTKRWICICSTQIVVLPFLIYKKRTKKEEEKHFVIIIKTIFLFLFVCFFRTFSSSVFVCLVFGSVCVCVCVCAVCVCTRCLRAVCRSGFLKKRKKLERQKGEKKEKRLESEDSFQRRRDPRVQVKECSLLSSSIFNVSDEIYRTTRNMFVFFFMFRKF